MQTGRSRSCDVRSVQDKQESHMTRPSTLATRLDMPMLMLILESVDVTDAHDRIDEKSSEDATAYQTQSTTFSRYMSCHDWEERQSRQSNPIQSFVPTQGLCSRFETHKGQPIPASHNYRTTRQTIRAILSQSAQVMLHAKDNSLHHAGAFRERKRGEICGGTRRLTRQLGHLSTYVD